MNTSVPIFYDYTNDEKDSRIVSNWHVIANYLKLATGTNCQDVMTAKKVRKLQKDTEEYKDPTRKTYVSSEVVEITEADGTEASAL